MRIGIISSGTTKDRIPPVYGGGIQKYIWNLGRELSDLGHEVHIFARLQPKQLKEELIDGINIHRMAGFLRIKFFTTFYFGFRTVINLLRIQKSRGPFDIIHTQSRVSGLLVRSIFRQKIVIFTAHNWDIAFTSPSDLIPFIPYALTVFIEKRNYVQCDKIIALTRAFAQILIKRYHVNPEKIRVIPNMVRIKDYLVDYAIQDSRLQKILKTKYLIFIGRLEREKGLKDLLENFNLIFKKSKDLNLVIIGAGQLEENLKLIKNQLAFKENLFILGNIHDKQKISLLKGAKALILPSDYEIMPTVILEAWAAGCIVIVNRYYGIDQFIQHRANGILYHKVESNELSPIILEALNNEELRENLIKNSKILINTKYSSSSISQQILRIYQNNQRNR